jgi:hypothetical protein
LSPRPTADLLLRDISGRHALALDTWASAQAERLIALLVPDVNADPTARVRGVAALGAFARPLAALPDRIPETDREAIRYAANNALHPPGPRGAGAPSMPE